MNSKNSILLVDPEFDPNTAGECTLLLKTTADSFSYAIIDKTCNQIRAVYDQQECEHVNEDLKAKLKNDSYLAIPFKEVKAALYTENTIAIPNDLFDYQNLDDYAKFFTSHQSDNLYTQTFANYNLTSIFTWNKSVEEAILFSLQNFQAFDHTAPVLALAKEKKAQTLVLDFTAKSFNAIYTSEGNLIFQNYYQIENSEEFNYYLLFIINQLGLQTADVTLYLSGIIHEDDTNYSCVSKYFKTISFIGASEMEIGDRILDDMPTHYYSSLLALDLCV